MQHIKNNPDHYEKLKLKRDKKLKNKGKFLDFKNLCESSVDFQHDLKMQDEMNKTSKKFFDDGTICSLHLQRKLKITREKADLILELLT